MRCMNPKVLAGTAAFVVAIAVLVPGVIGSAAPLLLMLVCPVSMLLVMRSMGARHDGGAIAPAPVDHAAGTAGAELVTLRAEVDQLRAELRDRQQAPVTDPS